MKKYMLVGLFERAKEDKAKYVGVRIESEKLTEPEFIINPLGNIIEKLKYYKAVYDDDLRLKSAPGIRITAAAQGDNVEMVMYGLEGRRK